STRMHLESILDRCHDLEWRTATIYRAFAAGARSQPPLCALWTELAREEERHARSIERARDTLRLRGDSRMHLDGWKEAIAEVEERLRAAERLGAGSTPTEQLAAALDIEMSEIEALRHIALSAARTPDSEHQTEHAEKLATAAEELSDDPQVQLQVALLR